MGPLYFIVVMKYLGSDSEHGATGSLLLRHSDVVPAVLASIVLASLAGLIVVLAAVETDAPTRRWTMACIVWTLFFASLPHMIRGLG